MTDATKRSPGAWPMTQTELAEIRARAAFISGYLPTTNEDRLRGLTERLTTIEEEDRA